MTRPAEPLRNVLGTGMRLSSGMDLLDHWDEGASQVEKNAIGAALFALLDRTVYHHYEVIDDELLARDLVVVVRDNLALRARINDADSFGIVYIGTLEDALEYGHMTRTRQP